MSKILITGASGFIGRALNKKLSALGGELILLSSAHGDITKAATLEPYAKVDISHMFHLAGRTFVPDSWDSPAAFYTVNVLGTTNVLEFCKSRGTAITFVSAYVYGHQRNLPIPESCKPSPSNPYALSKHLAEEICEFYARAHDLAITTLRPFNAYGKEQEQKFLVPTIIRQALTEERIVVEDLLPKRDYVFLDDLVDALVATRAPPKGHRVYNVGSGLSHSVKDVINVVQNVANTNKEVISKNQVRENELMDVVADITKAKNELGWQPKYSLRAGIENLIQFEREK